MQNSELVRKVRLYLDRARQDNPEKVEDHKPSEIGYWRIISGERNRLGDRDFMRGVFCGSFCDAVAYAVKQQEFYAWWREENDPGHRTSGEIKKVEVYELKDEGLIEAVKDFE